MKNRKYFILTRKSRLASIPILIIQQSFLDILRGYVEVEKNRWLTIYLCVYICTRTKNTCIQLVSFSNIKYFPFLYNFCTSILLSVWHRRIKLKPKIWNIFVEKSCNYVWEIWFRFDSRLKKHMSIKKTIL